MTRKKKVIAPKSRTREHELEIRRLNNWADMLLGIPFRHGDTPAPDEMNQFLRGFNEGKPLRAPFMGDKERLDIAMYLRGLARMPHVIDAKLAPQRGRGKPVDRKVRGRNSSIALDYEVTKERISLVRTKSNRSSTRSASGDAKTEIAKAYGTTAKTVTDAYTQCRKLQGWRNWASEFRQKFPLSGIELLQAISDELRAAKSG